MHHARYRDGLRGPVGGFDNQRVTELYPEHRQRRALDQHRARGWRPGPLFTAECVEAHRSKVVDDEQQNRFPVLADAGTREHDVSGLGLRDAWATAHRLDERRLDVGAELERR